MGGGTPKVSSLKGIYFRIMSVSGVKVHKQKHVSSYYVSFMSLLKKAAKLFTLHLSL